MIFFASVQLYRDNFISPIKQPECMNAFVLLSMYIFLLLGEVKLINSISYLVLFFILNPVGQVKCQ